jgi:hypothetical protein
MRFVSRSLCLAVLSWTSGCNLTSGRQIPDGLPGEAERASYGHIAIVEVSGGRRVYQSDIGSADFVDPLVGGLATGAQFTLDAAARGGDELVVGILLLPIIIPIAVIATQASNPTRKELAAQARMVKALESGYRSSRPREALTRRFLHSASAVAGATIRWEPAPPLDDLGRVDLRHMAGRRVDTVLELELVSIGTVVGADRQSFGFEVEVRATLLRSSDGTCLRHRTLSYEDSTRRRSGADWAEGSGYEVAKEIDHAISLLAERLAEDLFTHYAFHCPGVR